MLCRWFAGNTSAIQVDNKDMTCPSHCIRQTLIASKDTTFLMSDDSKKIDLGILGLSTKGVKVCKLERYESIP